MVFRGGSLTWNLDRAMYRQSSRHDSLLDLLMGHDAINPELADVRGFISYSHKDQGLVRRLVMHLIPAARAESGIDFWRDDSITAGMLWSEAHAEAVAQASVFILCMSANYLASEFIYNAELPTIKKQSRVRGALIIPVILTPCAWWGFVDDLQVVPTNKGRVSPISNWHPHEKGYVRATVEIIQRIQRHLADLKGQSKLLETKVEGAVAGPIQPPAPGTHRVPPRDIDRAVKTVIARRTAENGV
jgi:hypothetical protein